MNLGIVGGRNFHDYQLLENKIKSLYSAHDIDLIVSGGAQGADTLAERFAAIYHIPTKIYYPNWKAYGKQAGHIRNASIVSKSDIVIAFWDGSSRGTMSTIQLCKKQQKKCIVQLYRSNYMNRVVLIDGNNFAHICFHSAENVVRRKTKARITSDDYSFLEGMTYHLFFNKLFSIMDDFGPAHYAFIWDAKGGTSARKDIIEDYKSNRVASDNVRNVLFGAMNNLREILKSLPVYTFQQDGFEADDVIYHVAKEIDQSVEQINIISTDDDMIQVAQVCDNVRIFDPRKRLFKDIPGDYDITVYKSLAGDKSDNLSGVSGIGKKKAEIISKEIFGLTPSEMKRRIIQTLGEEKSNDFFKCLSVVSIARNPDLDEINFDFDYLFESKKIGNEFKSFLEKHNLNNMIKSYKKIEKRFFELYPMSV